MILTKDLYSNRRHCCGCEACAAMCPKEIIRMKADYDGFLYPEAFDPNECIDCKACLKVCPLKTSYQGDKAIKHFAGYHKNEELIKESASGGLASAISLSFIQNGGVVYGVKYSADFNEAIFSRCETGESLYELKGSKYVQARKAQLYDRVKIDLKDKKVLVIGLPCEIHALKLVMGKRENLLTCALICHGPTSPLVQKDYIELLESSVSSKVKEFTVRHKRTGVKPYFIKAEFENGGTMIEEFHPSMYGIAFKELKRPSCSECKFKLNYNESTIDADLIIGDYHGMTQNQEAYNKWGASQVSVMTHDGEGLIRSVDNSFNLYKISPRNAIHYNKALSRIIQPRWNRNRYAHILGLEGLEYASKLWSIKFIDSYQAFFNEMKSFLARMKKRFLR